MGQVQSFTNATANEHRGQQYNNEFKKQSKEELTQGYDLLKYGMGMDLHHNVSLLSCSDFFHFPGV